VFAEVMLAALAFTGDSYYDRSWRHAAAMVTTPPLRPSPDTANCLVNRLAKYVLMLFLFYSCYYLRACCKQILFLVVSVCLSVGLSLCTKSRKLLSSDLTW